MREKEQHRKAFERYFGLGPARSLQRLHGALIADEAGGGRPAPSVRTLEVWSCQFGWQGRLDEYERMARSVDQKFAGDAIREMNERQSKLGLLIQQCGAAWLARLAETGVDARTAIKAITEGARLEREARGTTGRSADRRTEDSKPVVKELWLNLGGPQSAYMYPDPDSQP